MKARALALGADLAGIASAKTLNAFPPDPRWPQTPERISPYVRSVIVLVQRIPAGAFRCKSNIPVQYMDMLVLRKMDKVAYRLAEELEAAGHPSFVVPAQETEWSYKRASYGRLSTRHLGVEAGLGTLGLEVNILTPEFGPRIYLTGVLTELELEADAPMREQVCIGEACSRCLHSCPGDAVMHFGIDKRGCAEHAQEFGFAQIMKFLDRVFDRQGAGRLDARARRHGPLARRLRLLARPVARRRLLRGLPALPRRLPGRQRLSRPSRRDAEGDPGEDAGEASLGQGIPGGAQARRRGRGPRRLEYPLGRARRLSGDRRAAAAGIQARAESARGGGEEAAATSEDE